MTTHDQPTFRCATCGALNRVPRNATKTPICGRCKKHLDTTGAPQTVDGVQLGDAVAKSPIPVVVDFWAPWCGPCRVAGPLFERVAKKYAGDVLALKVNGDENQATLAAHQIQGIPTFIIFRDGREASRQAGLPSPADFERWVAAAT